jgi:phi13 family phage major tail protein
MAVRIGFKNLYFSKMIEDNEAGAQYEPLKKLAAAIEGTISPSGGNSLLYADDGPSESLTSSGSGEVSLGVKYLEDEIEALIYGHELAEDGSVDKKSTDVPPYGALIFETTTSTGKSKYYVLYKTKFSPGELSAQTKGEEVEGQTDSVSGSFLRRDFDEKWMTSADKNNVKVTAASLVEWANQKLNITPEVPAGA